MIERCLCKQGKKQEESETIAQFPHLQKPDLIFVMISQKKIKKISRNRKSRNTKQAKTEIYEKPPAETPKQAKYEF